MCKSALFTNEFICAVASFVLAAAINVHTMRLLRVQCENMHEPETVCVGHIEFGSRFGGARKLVP